MLKLLLPEEPVVVKHNGSNESSWHSSGICCKPLHIHRINSRFFIHPHTKVWVTKASRATLLWSLLHLEPFFSRRTRRPFKCTGIVLRDVSCILIRVMMQKMFSFESCPIGETNTTECKKWGDGCLCGTQTRPVMHFNAYVQRIFIQNDTSRQWPPKKLSGKLFCIFLNSRCGIVHRQKTQSLLSAHDIASWIWNLCEHLGSSYSLIITLQNPLVKLLVRATNDFSLCPIPVFQTSGRLTVPRTPHKREISPTETWGCASIISPLCTLLQLEWDMLDILSLLLVVAEH